MTPIKPYPHLKVLLSYTLSPIGTGLVVLLLLSAQDLLQAPDAWTAFTSLLTVAIMGIFSTIVAILVFGIPAFVTGALVCLLRLKKTMLGVFFSAALGALVMGLSVIVFAQPSWETPALAAATAAVVGLWVLPTKKGRTLKARPKTSA